jgi:hypothetical protein
MGEPIEVDPFKLVVALAAAYFVGRLVSGGRVSELIREAYDEGHARGWDCGYREGVTVGTRPLLDDEEASE